MLPRINRLKKKKDFERVFKNGQGFKEDFLFLKFIRNNLDQSRFGFVVSKKTARKTVSRNKIKRKLREIIKKHLQKIKPGFDIVLIVKPGLENKNFPEIEKIIINRIFAKAKLNVYPVRKIEGNSTK